MSPAVDSTALSTKATMSTSESKESIGYAARIEPLSGLSYATWEFDMKMALINIFMLIYGKSLTLRLA